MTDPAVSAHLQAVFGLQVFERAVRTGREWYGLAFLTPAQWARAFQSALYQSLPGPPEALFAMASDEGLGHLMCSPQDEAGAAVVVHALYGRYFEQSGGYDRYAARIGCGVRRVVARVGAGGLSFVGLAPFHHVPLRPSEACRLHREAYEPDVRDSQEAALRRGEAMGA